MKLLRRVRGAIGMGVTWAAGWAATGILIGVASILTPGLPWHLFFDVFDAPLPALAVPGFVGGALFSVVLGIAGRHRRFDELALGRLTALGAVGGFLLAMVPNAFVALGLATPAEGSNLWVTTLTFAPFLMLLSAASAGATLLLARMSQRRHGLGRADDIDEFDPRAASPELHTGPAKPVLLPQGVRDEARPGQQRASE
ncbi:MAG: hypothetical protein ACT4OZ_17215 [Gemmatimonadota bacterium]